MSKIQDEKRLLLRNNKTNTGLHITGHKIDDAIDQRTVLSITSHTLSAESEKKTEELLALCLSRTNSSATKDLLAYGLKEIAGNAKKANLKRLFFKKNQLNIFSPNEYRRGMELFKKLSSRQTRQLIGELKQNQLYVKTSFQVTKDRGLIVEVANNSLITEAELRKARQKIEIAKKYQTIEEALLDIVDQEEGAGLGLIIISLIAARIGLKDAKFEIKIQNSETIARLTLPFNHIYVKARQQLVCELANRVNLLPHFKENISKLLRMTDQANADLGLVADFISRDIALTADLLKLINSARFAQNRKVGDIKTAMTILGIKGLRNWLFTYGAQTVLGEKEREIWDHAQKVAFSAQWLAVRHFKNSAIAEEAFTGGLLHDIGKLIIKKHDPHTAVIYQMLGSEQLKDRRLLEEFYSGLDHAAIGGMIAKKWNYPDNLVDVIRYHHGLANYAGAYRDTVGCVFLGNIISNYVDRKIVYNKIDPQALLALGVDSPTQMDAFLKPCLSEMNKTFGV